MSVSGAAAQSTVHGVVGELGVDRVHPFERPVGVLDPAHHLFVVVTRAGGEPEVEEDAVARAVGAFHEHR